MTHDPKIQLNKSYTYKALLVILFLPTHIRCNAAEIPGLKHHMIGTSSTFKWNKNDQNRTQAYFNTVKTAAEEGDSEALFWLGNIYALGNVYFDGIRVTQNHDQAFQYYKKAAKLGYGMAQYNVGCMYEENESIPQNYTKAVKYLKLAANQGIAVAKLCLGKLYSNGNGIEQNYNIAFEYYKSAADQGHPIGQYNVGVYYFKGIGTTQSSCDAIKYIQLAANQGDQHARTCLGLDRG